MVLLDYDDESKQIAINYFKGAKLRYEGMASLLKEVVEEMKKTLEETKVSEDDSR